MSTRGCVAVGTPKKWRGLFNHWDSYPTGLGKEVFEHLIRRRLEGKTLAEIGDDMLKFDEWPNYIGGGMCRFCGKITGQAHSYSGPCIDFECNKDKYPAGTYPDPKANHHSHNSLKDVSKEQITNNDPDPLFLEWVYVIDPKADAIHVLAHESCKKTKLRRPEVELRQRGPFKLSGGRWHYGHCVYKHVLVATLKLSEKPDWEKVECGELYERCNHYAYHHFPELEGTPSARIGTREYIGTDPLCDMHDAYGFIIDGKYAQKNGHGFLGGEHFAYLATNRATQRGVWYEGVTFAGGEKRDMPVAYANGNEYRPYKGVAWLFPPTLHAGYSSRPVIDAAALEKALAEKDCVKQNGDE